MLKNREKDNNKYIYLACILLIFLSFLSFYTVAHPMYIYDTDDWTYIAYSRNAWPSVQQWNPTKILPETLMPFVAEFGVKFIMPFIHDYIKSIAFAFALVAAGVETVYFVMFIVLLRKVMNIRLGVDVIIGIMLILFHFLPFNNANVNEYMLYGKNVTCFFNYIIPGMLNAGAMMYFTGSTCEKIRKEKSLKSGFLILLIYLSINSNMFHSIILISFIGTELLYALMNTVKENIVSLNVIKKYIENNLVKIMILSCWLMSVILEANGARAKWVQGGKLEVKETLKNFILSIVKIKKEWFGCLLIIMFAAILIFSVKKRNKQIDNIDIQYINILNINIGERIYNGYLFDTIMC